MKELIPAPSLPQSAHRAGYLATLSSNPGRYGYLSYLVIVAGVAVATAVMHALLPLVSDASIYLVYLVVVVAVSVNWGLKHGALASVLGFLAANYFFTQPRFTFTVAAIQDVVALVTFLGLAILTSELVARLRREAEDARRNQQITATLYALSQTITTPESLPRMLNEISEQLRSALDLAGCTISLAEVDGRGKVTATAGQSVTPEQAPEDASPRMVSVPLSADGQSLGVLQLLLWPDRRSLTLEEKRIVAAFAEQLQAAIERDQLQQAAVQAEVLRRTDALRAALLSAVAHDLRTPLTSIKTAATSLLGPRVEWTKDEQQGFLGAIVSEVDRIDRMVSDLLDMSRIEAGRMVPHKEPHHIAEVIDTVIERLRPRLGDHPLSIHVEAHLPAVLLDEVQIDEVLTNLLENAIKYTPAGTPVEVRARRVPSGRGSAVNAVQVEVADRGPGIPPEHLPHLFSRFYRVTAGSASKATGIGLGLSIVKGIVEAHGGQVSAANALGGGAVFGFTLPLSFTEERSQEDGELAIAVPIDNRHQIAHHEQEFSQ